MNEQQLKPWDFECPYCGESIQSWLDLSQGDYQTIEDCPVCCRPIELSVTQGPFGIELTAHTDSD